MPCFIFVVISLLVSPFVWGGQVPIGAVSTGNNYDPSSFMYVNMSWTTIGNPIVDNSVVSPTSCYGTCYYGFLVKYHTRDSPSRFLWSAQNVVATTPTEVPTTWGELSETYSSRYGRTGTITTRWGYTSEGPIAVDCVTFGIVNRHDQSTYDPPTLPIGNVCLDTVNVNQCVLSSPSIILDHGNMLPQEIDGHTAKGIVTISCGSELEVTFSTSPGGDLRLKDDQISSHLTINGKELNAGSNALYGRNDFEIISTLKTEGKITGGPFTGSQTLIVSLN